MNLTPQTGDWLLFHGSESFISKAIRRFTFGRVNHAAMMYDNYCPRGKNLVFETDGAWFKAKFNPLSRYSGKEVYIVRPRFYTNLELVRELCQKYEGTPYDYVQIGVHALNSWLHPEIQKKIVTFLTSDKFMICSELTARITYESTEQKLLTFWEGLTPEALLDLGYNHPFLFTVEHGIL